jgi:predicted lipid-binding transport protein (Tim44 family)
MRRRSTARGSNGPRIDLADLGRLVADAPPTDPASRRQREPTRRPVPWHWSFQGWMGPMFGPLPVGHLALGLIGLYFKLR